MAPDNRLVILPVPKNDVYGNLDETVVRFSVNPARSKHAQRPHV